MNVTVYSFIRSMLFKSHGRVVNRIAPYIWNFENHGIKRWLNQMSRCEQSRQPAKIKMDISEFRTLFTPEMKKLLNIFEKYNHELKVVGGSIRDLLMRKQIGDIDLASTATPHQMKEMFKKENVRVIQEKNATLTARIEDKENFAITSLRRIIVTNSNETKHEYTTDWYLDASNRDLTINAMYMDFDGTVFDYFNGVEDLEKGRIRFVGNSQDRIREDYLRILRYFRFYGVIANDPHSHQPEVLKVIKENIHGLSEISKNRIWSELKKVLSSKFGPQLMRTMLEVGIRLYIGLPDEVNLTEFERFCKKTSDLTLHPITIIAALLKNEVDMMSFTDQMLISHFEEDVGNFIIGEREKRLPENLLKYYQEYLIVSLENRKEVRQSIEQFLTYCGEKKVLKDFQNWEMPEFPVNGRDLADRGILPTRRMGFIKRALKKLWFDSSYTLTKEVLLSNLKDIETEVDANFETLKKTNKMKKKRKKKKHVVN